MATMVFSTSGLAFADENGIDKNVPEIGKMAQQTTTNGSSESQEAVRNEEANQATRFPNQLKNPEQASCPHTRQPAENQK